MECLINIDVPDLELGTRFYTEAFALTVGRRFGADGIELLGGPAPLYLLAKPEGTSAFTDGEPRRYTRHWTPVHLDFVVRDIGAAVRTATLAGAQLERELSSHAWGRLALMSDPFGHGFCFVQFSALGYDALTQGPRP